MNRPAVGTLFSPVTFPAVKGGTLTVGSPRPNWTLFVVYRGRHCGRCKKYLNILEGLKADWEAAGFDIVVTSADPIGKVQDDIAEFGWTFDMGHGLTEEQIREMGLYVSDPLSAQETDRRFAEPGLFVLWPDGTVQIAAISNGPAARPELGELLDGMIFTKNNNKPPRGMA